MEFDSSEQHETCDVAIIGGGFYGTYLAQKMSGRVILFEREAELMTQASYGNQARVHNGYHYPRSILTALRSRVNFARFVSEFQDAIDSSYESIYAVPRRFSKVNASQFLETMNRIGAPISQARSSICDLFDADWIEGVYTTVEHAFDASILREIIWDQLKRSSVDVRLSTSVSEVSSAKEGEAVKLSYTGPQGEGCVIAKEVLCCTYCNLNEPGEAAGLGRVPLKHEFTELALVEPPSALAELGITVMDGPFFSLMPFPARKLHSLSHVRYTPHGSWFDSDSNYTPADAVARGVQRKTSFPHMVRDAAKFLPVLRECKYVESLWQVKTVLPASERDDSRPILFAPNHSIAGYHLVMGGKIDNVYDIVDAARPMLRNMRA